MNCPRCGEPYVARWNEGGISHLEARSLCRPCEIIEWHAARDRTRDAVIERAAKDTREKKS